ncbi:MAG: hypothetical protein HY675_14185 [Chloroflexi bacterium]|nr:hypothetical protein [Chloroflexota bacterium]
MSVKVDVETVSRRRFITHVMGGIGAAIATILGLPLSRYVAFPATSEPQVNWAEADPADDFKIGEMTQLQIDPTYDAPLAVDKGKRAAVLFLTYKGATAPEPPAATSLALPPVAVQREATSTCGPHYARDIMQRHQQRPRFRERKCVESSSC